MSGSSLYFSGEIANHPFSGFAKLQIDWNSSAAASGALAVDSWKTDATSESHGPTTCTDDDDSDDDGDDGGDDNGDDGGDDNGDDGDDGGDDMSPIPTTCNFTSPPSRSRSTITSPSSSESS